MFRLLLLFATLFSCALVSASAAEVITVGAAGSCPDLENGCDFDERSLHLAVDYSQAGDEIVLYGDDIYVNQPTAASEPEALISITHQLTISGHSATDLVKVHVGAKKRLFSIEHSQVTIRNLEVVRPLTRVHNEEGQDIVLMVQGSYSYGGQQSKRNVVSLLNFGSLRDVTIANVDFRSSKSHTNIIFSAGRYLDINIHDNLFGAAASTASKRAIGGSSPNKVGTGAIDLTFGARFINLRVEDNYFDSVANALNVYVLPGSKSDAHVSGNYFYLSSSRFYGDNAVVHNEQGCVDSPTESELVLVYEHNTVEGGRLAALFVHGASDAEPIVVRDNHFYGVVQGATPGANVPKCMEIKASVLMMDNNTMEECAAVFTSDEMSFLNSQVDNTQLTLKPASCYGQVTHQLIRNVTMTGVKSKLYQPSYPHSKEGVMVVVDLSMDVPETEMQITDKTAGACEMQYEHAVFNNVTDAETHALLYHTDPEGISFNQFTSSFTGKVQECPAADPDTGRPQRFDRDACECVSLTAYELIVVDPQSGRKTLRPVRYGHIANADNTQEILIGTSEETSPATTASLTALWIILIVVGGLLVIGLIVAAIYWVMRGSGGGGSSYYAGAEYGRLSAEDKRKNMYASVRDSVVGGRNRDGVRFAQDEQQQQEGVFIDQSQASSLLPTKSSADIDGQQLGLHHRVNASSNASSQQKAWKSMDTLDFGFQQDEEDSE